MKIGFDAKWFFSGPPSGIVVVRNILQKLIELTRTHELHIFLDRRDRDKSFPCMSENVHLHYVWGDNNLLSNLILLPPLAIKLDIDVFVFMNFTPIGGRFKKIAFVLDVIFESNPEFFTPVERLYFSPLKFLTRRAHRVCTISDSEKQRMLAYGYTRHDLIDVISLGVDKCFMPKDEISPSLLDNVRCMYSLPESFILYVGRLNARKNIVNLLKALALINNKKIPLVIVGESSWKTPDIQSAVDELGLANRVLFTGRVESSHLYAIFALATVFTFPSFVEGFGLPPLEAMASGVPVVVSDCSSLPEVCADAGTYVNPHHPMSIATGINRLFDDEEYYEAMRNKGLKRAQVYDWRISAEKLLESINTAFCSS